MSKIFQTAALLLIISTLLSPMETLAVQKPILFNNTGVDGIMIGMRQKEIAKTRQDIKLDPETAGCHVTQVKNKKLMLLLEDGIVNRIYISSSRYVTTKGIRIGSTEKQAIAAYGNALKIAPHKYVENGHYLTLMGKDNKGYLFETKNKRITNISIGTLNALQLVEACS